MMSMHNIYVDTHGSDSVKFEAMFNTLNYVKATHTFRADHQSMERRYFTETTREDVCTGLAEE